MEVAYIDAFHADPVRFWSFYGQSALPGSEGKAPQWRCPRGAGGPEAAGILDGVITQNIDMAPPPGRHLGASCRGTRHDRHLVEACHVRGSVELAEEGQRRGDRRGDDGVPRCEHCGARRSSPMWSCSASSWTPLR